MTQGVSPYPNPRPSFEWPVTPPDSGANDGNIAVVCFSEAWRPFIVGALKQLLLESTWQGNADQITTALGIATDIIGQFSQETAACTEIMVIKNIRYNVDTDTTQTDFGNTGSWTDNPTLDPRNSTAFLMPPRVTDDAKCDAAAGMTAAFKGFIDAGIHYLSIVEITGALVEFLLTLIPEIGWLIELLVAGAEALVAAGQTALTDDFTTLVYQQVNCAIYCHINFDGSITAAELGAIIDQVGVEQITLVSVLFELFTRMVGVVGFQNAGATSDLTGDCSDCLCCPDAVDWCETILDTSVNNDGGFTPDNSDSIWGGFTHPVALFANNTGSPPPDNYAWVTTEVSRSGGEEIARIMIASRTLPEGTYTNVRFHWQVGFGTFTTDIRECTVKIDGNTMLNEIVDGEGDAHWVGSITGTPTIAIRYVCSYRVDSGSGGGGGEFTNLVVEGTGTKPTF